MTPLRRGRTARSTRAMVLTLLVAVASVGAALMVGLAPLVSATAAVATHAVPGDPLAPAAVDPSIDVAVTRVSPAVVTPGTPVSVQVTVTNNRPAPVSGVVVRALYGRSPLATRTAVRQYHAGIGRAPSTQEVARVDIPGPIAARGSSAATLHLDPGGITASAPYGAHPLVVEATTGADTVQERTFLPVHARKEYEPMRLAVAMPMTLDPDPALVTATGDELDDAWRRLAGPGSRVDRILTATAGHLVTMAIDPALVGYTDTPASTTNPTPGPSPTTGRPEGTAADAGPPPSSEVISALTGAVASRLTRHETTRLWELPPGDPDLAALSRPDADTRLLDSIAATDTGLARLLGRPGMPIPRIAWPVAALGDTRRLAVDTAFAGRPDGSQAAFITSSDSVDADPDNSGQASRRTPGGSPLLVYDEELSDVLSSATSAIDAGGVTQRFLAESLTLLAESPGRARTVFVAAPRGLDPDPVALRALLDAGMSAPWIVPVTADQLIETASTPDAPRADPGPPGSAAGPHAPGEAAEDIPPPSPLTPAVISRLIDVARHLGGVSSVLAPTGTSNLVPRADTIQALASTRWRGNSSAFETTSAAVHDRIETLTTGVSVLPSTVNFLADHGVLQVTAVNNLDVAVHNVRLVFEPQGRTPRLRVVDPAPLSIAPNSRTTVRVSVEAIAAGVVPVSTYLTTATGTRLGTDATVNVRVQPTGGWIVAVGGVLAGLVFVVGLFRTLRRGRPRVSDADLEGIDLQ